MNTNKPKRQTRADLQREVKELRAQLVHQYHFASAGIARASTDHFMGGGVLLELTGLGGRTVIEPVVIRDGLSADTIAALQRDLARSYQRAIEFKPKSGDKS